jgi:hypothetical protein
MPAPCALTALQWIVRAAIPSLLFHRSPAAVSGRVRAIIINAVDAHPIRPWAHIFNESLERIAPSITDSDAPSSVFSVVLAARVQASLFDLLPDVPYLRMSLAVCSVLGPGLFAAKATTARCGSVANVIQPNNTDRPAVALAFPPDAPANPASSRAHGNKPPVALPGDIKTDMIRAVGHALIMFTKANVYKVQMHIGQYFPCPL